MLVVGWPYAEADAYKADVEANYLKTLELAPEFADRVRGATREERFAGGAVPNFFRKPYGPGWALVGDAGYNKDPITAQGITDAFRDAELCADRPRRRRSAATRSFDDAMAGYHATRDARVLPIYEFTTQLATLEAPPPEMQQLLGAVHGNRDGDGRVRERHRRHRLAGRVLRSRQPSGASWRRPRRLNDLLGWRPLGSVAGAAHAGAAPARAVLSVSPTRPRWPWVHGRR